MNLIEAVIMGIVQGVAEWLPISSKSHLILIQQLFGVVQPPIVDLIINLGSLLIVLFVFRKDIKDLVLGLIKKDKQSWLMFLWLVIATIPIVIAGYLLEKVVKESFNSLKVLGFGFLFTAIILYLSQYPKIKEKSINVWSGLLIGISQILSLFPGISRSATTISTGMIFGVKKEDVARFSFLLFIPTILGATMLELKDISKVTDIGNVIVATITAMIAGYLSLKLLLNIIYKEKFWYFSIYCLILGILVLLWAYKII